MIKIFKYLIVLALSSALLAEAESIPYFEATVPVQSQSSKERGKAAAAGLERVLVRITGIENVFEYEAVQDAMAKAPNFLEQFQYRTVEGEGERYLAMVMSFPPQVIENIRKKAGLPLWPLNRPRVLVWLVEDTPEEGKVIVKDESMEAIAGLREGAAYRGVPLFFPLLDLDDQLAISAEDVWDLNEEKIKAASERYGADSILVGRYTLTSRGEWLSSWQFIHGDMNRAFDLNSENIKEVGVGAIKPVADQLARVYSITESTEDYAFVPVQIDSVSSFKDYRRVMNYLDGLALISEYKLVTAQPGVLRVDVLLSGDLKQLEDAINLDGKMLMLPSDTTSYSAVWMGGIRFSSDNPLRLQWRHN